jgi:aminoglycoside 2'-N-acetyltransferase I
VVDAAFGDGHYAEADWRNALGGLHALAYHGERLVGHGALVQRRLLHRGRALRTGFIEALAVLPERQRQGHGAAIMQALERVIRAAYELGALSVTEAGEPFYAARGWRRWRGPTSVLSPQGLVRTPDDDGAVYVLEVVPVDLTAPLACDWREGDPW